MATLILINSLLIGLVSVTALAVMVYWHRATGGGWRRTSTGRTNMHLLAIIFFITANAAIQSMIPVPMAVKVPFYFGLYIVFAVALARIGLNIRTEVARGRRQAAFENHPASHIHTEEQYHD